MDFVSVDTERVATTCAVVKFGNARAAPALRRLLRRLKLVSAAAAAQKPSTARSTLHPKKFRELSSCFINRFSARKGKNHEIENPYQGCSSGQSRGVTSSFSSFFLKCSNLSAVLSLTFILNSPLFTHDNEPSHFSQRAFYIRWRDE